MPDIQRLVVTLPPQVPLEQRHKDMLQQAAPHAEIRYYAPSELTGEQLAWADVCFGLPSINKLRAAKDLKWLQLNIAGVDYYFSEPDVLREDMLLTNATGAYGLSIAEYTVAGLMMLMRKLHLYRDNQHKQLWQERGVVQSIYGSTVLVVGLGDLGSEIAQRMKLLGAHTIGVRRADTRKPDCVDELYLMDALDNLLPRADAVILCLPSTPETRQLFGKERLALLKQDSYLVNVGRGNAVDSMALCQLLHDGKLAGALLDVTDPEPLPSGHPLWLEENALITPHCSGGYTLAETSERLYNIAVENMRRYAASQPLHNLVDFSTQYRRLI